MNVYINYWNINIFLKILFRLTKDTKGFNLHSQNSTQSNTSMAWDSPLRGVMHRTQWQKMILNTTSVSMSCVLIKHTHSGWCFCSRPSQNHTVQSVRSASEPQPETDSWSSQETEATPTPYREHKPHPLISEHRSHTHSIQRTEATPTHFRAQKPHLLYPEDKNHTHSI